MNQNQNRIPPPARLAGGDWSSWYQTYCVQSLPSLPWNVLAADPIFLHEDGSGIFWPEIDQRDFIDPSENVVSSHETVYPNSVLVLPLNFRNNIGEREHIKPWVTFLSILLTWSCRNQTNQNCKEKTTIDRFSIHF